MHEVTDKPIRAGRIVAASTGVACVLLAFSAVAYAAFYSGTTGDDTLIIEAHGSVAYMNAGNDRFFGARGHNGGSDSVRGGAGNDRLISYGRVDMLHGGRGDDYVDGGAHKNGLFGGRGNDTLVGGNNVDHFQPGQGTDTCFGQREDINFPGSCEDARFVSP